ncbi:MAG TPA: hypothetical protein VMA83_05705 [Solirubrobacteraceae bacterium]|nr:hypothetical protein [Solirubrobacteraceae bacterium]
MRRVKTTIGTAVVFAAMTVFAAPALATSTATFESTGGATKGTGEEQRFKIGPFDIECEGAKTKGSVAAGTTKTLFAEIKMRKCSTIAKVGSNPIKLKTSFKSMVDVEYHANGFLELGSESEEGIVLKGGEVEIEVPPLNTSESGACTIYLYEQTLPTKAEKDPENEYSLVSFANEMFTSGKHTYTRLHVKNEVKGIHSEFGGGQCEEFVKAEEELKSGTWEGELTQQVAKGNLSWTDTP